MTKRGQSSAEKAAGFGPIAERFRRGGDLERAVTLCREGLAKFPDHLSGRVTLGWALLDLGRYDEARGELEQVLKRAPDNLAAIRGLAELHDRAESTMYLDMASPGAWPPELPTTEDDQKSADEFARNLSAAEMEAPQPGWQAPSPAAAAPAPIPVSFSSEADTPEIITTAQAAMQDLGVEAGALAAAEILDAMAAPIDLVTTTEAAIGRTEPVADESAGPTTPAVELDAPVVIQSAAEAIAIEMSEPASAVDIEPVEVTGAADLFESKTELDDLAAALVEAADAVVPAPESAVEVVAIEAAAEDADDLAEAIAALGETPGATPTEPIIPTVDVSVPAEDAVEVVEVDLAGALADAGAADAVAAFEAAEQTANDLAAEVAAHADSHAVDMDVSTPGERRTEVEAGESLSVPHIELDLVPADAADAMAAAEEVAVELQRASDAISAANETAADGAHAAETAAAHREAHRLSEMPAGDADFLHAQQAALSRLDADAADDADPVAAMSLEHEAHASDGFHAPLVDLVVPEPDVADIVEPMARESEPSAFSIESPGVARSDSFPRPTVETVLPESPAHEVSAQDLSAALMPESDWEPPIPTPMAEPPVTETPAAEAEPEPAIALEAAVEPEAAIERAEEPELVSLASADDVLSELAVALAPVAEPAESDASLALELIDPAALLELTTMPAAGPAEAAADSPALPELELLELPEDSARASRSEPFKPDIAAMYDASSPKEPTRSGRAKGKYRKGKSTTSPLPALERLLRRVETRRAEIASETLA